VNLSGQTLNLDSTRNLVKYPVGTRNGIDWFQMDRVPYVARRGRLSLSRSYPEGRQCRSDKKFGNHACRQTHHRSKKRASGDRSWQRFDSYPGQRL